MERLFNNFQGYLQLNLPKTKWIILFGFVSMILFCVLQRKGFVKYYGISAIRIIFGSLLSLNCSFIFVMTLFSRSIGTDFDFRAKPFDSYYAVFTEGNMEILLQILVNIAMCIPLGFLLPCCFKLFEKYRYVILVTFCGSLVIELIQLIFRMGLFEVDDIINNTLGSVIGLLLYIIFLRGKNEHNKQKIS